MVELVTADGPDIVALQEVPVWALARLERWTGMAARWVVTAPALLVAPLARLVTELNAALFRSLVTGQANALLFGPRVRVGEQRLLCLTPSVSRWAWLVRRGIQQRYLQAVDVEAEGRGLTVANVHTTNDPRRARGEVARAAAFVADAERCVLLGDFNVRRPVLEGFSPALAGIDQILVRGLELEGEPRVWPRERRTLDGLVLSDHAPVEAIVR